MVLPLFCTTSLADVMSDCRLLSIALTVPSYLTYVVVRVLCSVIALLLDPRSSEALLIRHPTLILGNLTTMAQDFYTGDFTVTALPNTECNRRLYVTVSGLDPPYEV
jgi:hypothetical protein